MKPLLFILLIFSWSVYRPAFGQELAANVSSRANASIADAHQASGSHAVAVFYVLPNDISYRQEVMDSLVAASLEIQAWYQIATGGVTFEFAYPEIVKLYRAKQPRQFYLDNGGWWVAMGTEMQHEALPIWKSGTISVLWVHGGGHHISGGSSGCDLDCGQVLLGVEMFTALNDTSITGEDECPPDRSIDDGRPCLPLGAYAHEIGHAFGLDHPDKFPETKADSIQYHTVMQTFHNYPLFGLDRDKPWGLLTVERTALRQNPFMDEGVDLVQVHDSAFVVNIPHKGPAPPLAADYTKRQNEVRFTADAPDANLFYWMFGDGMVSNEPEPTHAYADTGSYVATVRASDGLSMMSRKRMVVHVTELNDPPDALRALSDTALVIGEAAWILDLQGVFVDPNGDSLSFSVSSSDESVAGLELDAANLTITAKSIGASTITVTASDGRGEATDISFVVTVPTGVSTERPTSELPLAFSLSQNYPNPFRSSTRIGYTLRQASQVEVTVYDAYGRLVRRLFDGFGSPGRKEITFDAADLADGVYFLRLETGGVVTVRSMTLLR